MAEPQLIEEFRLIVDFPGYRASNFGRIQSCKILHGHLPSTHGDVWHDLKPTPLHGGRHLFVRLWKDRRGHFRYVHRLVLEAFVGPCPAGMECCHDPDPNPANNHLSNLRWDTHYSNICDAVRNGRHLVPRKRYRGELNQQSKITNTDAKIIRLLRSQGIKLRVLAVRFGISETHVSRIALGRCRLLDDEDLAAGVNALPSPGAHTPART